MTEQFISRRRRKKSSAPALVVIGGGAVICFAVAFILFWTLGSRLAGGDGLGLPGLSPLRGQGSGILRPIAVVAEPVELPIGVDLQRFRDMAYVPVKGIYVSSWGAGSSELFPRMVDLADRTEINAMVIDVKDSTGYVSYDCSVPTVRQLKLWEGRIPKPAEMMATLDEHNIFPIARIVCFNDPLLATKKPEWAVMNKNGGIWKDNKGSSYINPYNRQVWKYLVDLAEDAADRGFREIQFDYVRFPSDGKISETSYPGKWGTMEDAIAGFLSLRQRPSGEEGRVGVRRRVRAHRQRQKMTGYRPEDREDGSGVDIVCPMIYPSHYYAGSYDIKNPNRSPYDIVVYASKDASRRLEGTGCVYRPVAAGFLARGGDVRGGRGQGPDQGGRGAGLLGVAALGSLAQLHGGRTSSRRERERLGSAGLLQHRVGEDQGHRLLATVGEVDAVDALLPDLVRHLGFVDKREAERCEEIPDEGQDEEPPDAQVRRFPEGRPHQQRSQTLATVGVGHHQRPDLGEILPGDVQRHAAHHLTVFLGHQVVTEVLVEGVKRPREHLALRGQVIDELLHLRNVGHDGLPERDGHVSLPGPVRMKGHHSIPCPA